MREFLQGRLWFRQAHLLEHFLGAPQSLLAQGGIPPAKYRDSLQDPKQKRPGLDAIPFRGPSKDAPS